MRKRILALVLVVVLLAAGSTTAFAAENEVINETNTPEVITQEYIDNTLEAVFDYLNENDEGISLEHREIREYQIPVNGHIVTATVGNEQVRKTRAIGSNNYDVVANTSYTYWLTISNIYSGSGEILYTINYKTGNPVSASQNTIYFLTVKSVTIDATPPNGFSLDEKETTIGSTNGNITVRTAGYARFIRPIFSSVSYHINTLMGSMSGSIVTIQYEHYIP